MFGFGSNANNNSNDVNVNTKIKTWYSELSCIQLTYWNENLSIRINPLKSVSPDGLRQYDYQRKINTALTQEKASALYDGIKKLIIPAIDKVGNGESLDKPVSVGFPVGKNNAQALFVEYSNDDKGIPSVYIKYYTGIGADGKPSSDGTFAYKFNSLVRIENYDPNAGTGTEVRSEGEFGVFCSILKNMTDILGSAAHSVNYDKEYSLRRDNNYNQNNNQSSYQAPANSYSAPVSESAIDGVFPFE